MKATPHVLARHQDFGAAQQEAARGRHEHVQRVLAYTPPPDLVKAAFAEAVDKLIEAIERQRQADYRAWYDATTQTQRTADRSRIIRIEHRVTSSGTDPTGGYYGDGHDYAGYTHTTVVEYW